jgi:hypothetical protein
MAKSTSNNKDSNANQNQQTAINTSNPEQAPPPLPAVTQPVTQLRENVNKGESRQVDTPSNVDK